MTAMLLIGLGCTLWYLIELVEIQKLTRDELVSINIKVSSLEKKSDVLVQKTLVDKGLTSKVSLKTSVDAYNKSK